MLSASIKLSNLQYLTALEQIVLSNTQNLVSRPKLQTIPFYNFVCTFIDILSQFSKLQSSTSQSEYQPYNLNSFLVDFYFRKYGDNNFEIYRQLFSFLRSWKKYTENYEQARLFISLLTQQRNSKQMIRQFLKIRKCILKNINFKILQEINISHQDALAISHSLFSNNQQVKLYVTKKINEIFISLKRKLVNSAQINGAALCQFYMSCLQKFSQQNISSLFKQDIKAKQKHSIQFFAKQNLRLPLPQQQAPSMNPELDPCVDKPYNLSFSQQYASYYSPQISDGLKQVNFSRKNLKQGELNEWGEKESSVLRVRDSLTFFKQRDREIDQKLKRYGAGGRGEGMDGLGKQNRSKPQGWESFVRSNEVAKKRLINKGYREVEV